MGRKKISISKITDERNRQVSQLQFKSTRHEQGYILTFYIRLR